MKVGRRLGSVNDFPRYMHGVGCGLTNRLGDTYRQRLVATTFHFPIEMKPVKTYPAGRKCEVCGCLISIYNSDSKCALHQGK